MEKSKRRKHRNRYFTGEDIDMLNERNWENRQKKENKNICDSNIDGA